MSTADCSYEEDTAMEVDDSRAHHFQNVESRIRLETRAHGH